MRVVGNDQMGDKRTIGMTGVVITWDDLVDGHPIPGLKTFVAVRLTNGMKIAYQHPCLDKWSAVDLLGELV